MLLESLTIPLRQGHIFLPGTVKSLIQHHMILNLIYIHRVDTILKFEAPNWITFTWTIYEHLHQILLTLLPLY